MNLHKTSLSPVALVKGETHEFAEIISCQIEQIPFTYLGIPLISGRFTVRECLPLLEKILTIITNWKNNFLSYADRAELIK